MYRPVRIIILLSVFLLLSQSISAQMKVVRGVVLDQDGNPLPGAGVLIKEIKGKGVSADIDGNFIIDVPSQGRTLIISSLGMETVEYQIPEKPVGGA